jgi:general secretion pathway protein E
MKMNCEECRELLAPYLKAALDRSRQEDVREHLATCAGCAAEAEDTRQVLAVLDRASDDPAIRLATEAIERAYRDQASDIHLRALPDHGVVLHRVDGVLREAMRLEPEAHQALVDRFKLMAGMVVVERGMPQDGRILAKLEGKELDLRVSVVPSVGGESLVVRLLDRSMVRFTLDDVCLGGEHRQQVEELLHRPNGIMFVTGPTGSGKTTTLYALLHELNHPGIHIMSVEDPVEYRIDGITQVAVNRRVGLDFQTGVRHCMRQDPDVIMCGEIRDLETLELMAQVAITGHLVLSTLHTNDAVGVIRRLVDVGLQERFMIASTLLGATAQRLLRQLCRDCREEVAPTEQQLAWLREAGVAEAPERLWRAVGCAQCRSAGYRGRHAIYEVLVVDTELRDMIARGDDLRDVERAAARKLTPLKQAAAQCVLTGVTTVEEAARMASFMPRYD